MSDVPTLADIYRSLIHIREELKTSIETRIVKTDYLIGKIQAAIDMTVEISENNQKEMWANGGKMQTSVIPRNLWLAQRIQDVCRAIANDPDHILMVTDLGKELRHLLMELEAENRRLAVELKEV